MKPLQVGQRAVGAGERCMLVAEVGINHNGDLQLGRRMIDAAARAGADAVKFQNYRTEDFISDRALTYEYVSQGRKVVESQYEMFKRCELTREGLRELKRHCDQAGVQFHSTPTSEAGIRDLLEVGVPALKNGSDYLTHLPLIQAMGKTGLPTVISTGMALPAEIGAAVDAFRATGNEQLVLLHCTSSYPTPPADTHLRKIPALAAAHRCLVGFSDHTEGVEAALGALALGACWIEKHFTLDTGLPGPDHRFSSDPAQFTALAAALRRLEQALGEARLGPAASEAEGRVAYRLSCVTARPLRAGHALQTDDVTFSRPGTGLPPAQAGALIGRRLKRPLDAGHVIAPQDLE
jgi:N-acetylneuraminate synthase/N,N'-diacetyllegionaminate synthase